MFNTKIPIYGIFILISIFSGLYIVYKNVKILGYKKEENIGLLLYTGLGAIFGAKYYSLIMNPQKYKPNFSFFKLGLSSYGAVIGIIILVLLFCKQFKKNIKELLYILLPSLPLMYGIGKLGCFFAGCCHGIEYDGIFSIAYNYYKSDLIGVKLFPIQLLEAIIFILIFIYALYIVNKKRANNNNIGQIFLICGFAKFLLDFLRMSHIGKIFSSNQIISIIFIIIGIFLMIKKEKRIVN